MIECQVCGSFLQSVKSYVEHCRIHANVPNIQLPCCFKNCRKGSPSYAGLRQHIARDHGGSQSNTTLHETSFNLQCNVVSCTTRCCTVNSLVKHLQQHIREGSSVECPIYGCNKKYSVRSSFACHLNRDHASWSQSQVKANVQCTPTESVTRDIPSQSDFFSEDGDDDAIDDDSLNGISDLESLKENFIKNLSMFFLKLSTQFLIPDSTVELIVQEMLNVSLLNQLYIQHSVCHKLASSGVDSDTISLVKTAVEFSDLMKSCLEDGGILHSGIRRSSYVKQNFSYVEPRSMYVGLDTRNKSRYYQYVPVKESLAVLLQDQSVLKQCMSPYHSDSGVFQDFPDGFMHKQVAQELSDNRSLSLLLYQDSFEIVNPLGSAKRKHKMLGVYYVLGNLETYNRSSIDHTQLVMLANETDVDRAGQRIFKPLVDDLKVLEKEGIEISGERWLVKLAAIAGDNLGSHWLGGFTTNFSSSEYMCRFCTLTRTEFDSGCIVATKSQMRTPDSYNAAVAELNCDEELETVAGIKHQSAFNQLQHFHVCSPGLPPCVAHDLFEGIVCYDLPLCLKYFVKLKLFTVKQLNMRIEHLKLYGSDAKVRPAALSEKLVRLSGSASQNWCLLRFIPLLIYDLVNCTDEIYLLIMLLRSVVELVMAPVLSVGQISYMKVIIEDYLDKRRKFFPETPLRPKHHYLSHYPWLTLHFGPLVRLWTMRFESKHQYFKRCVRNSHNFVNVTRMLARRHQVQQAYFSAGLRFATTVIVGKRAAALNSELLCEVRQLLSSLGLADRPAFLDMTVRGTVYTAGCVLPLTALSPTRDVIFGEILLIITIPDVRFVVSCRAALYDTKLGCYCLLDKRGIQCLSLCAFADHYPLCIYDIDNQNVVVLKHQVLERD